MGENGISNGIKEWLKSLLLAIIIALLVRNLIVEIYLVEGFSMNPGYNSGERLVVDKFTYNLSDPSRGEVIVFSYSEDKNFIKRVIALPGETIKIRDGSIYIDEKPLEEDYNTHDNEKENFGPRVVPDNHYFVLGDNRRNSIDSRSFGAISEEEIEGKAVYIFWPLDDFRSAK